VSLEIADTGPGISSDVARRVFEPFFTTKPVGLGTGLGLSICKGIVEQHGGVMTLDPGPGRGARFRVELPVGAPQGGTSSEAGAPAAGLRVLIVDDEPNVAEVAAEMLMLDGHSAEVVSSADQALERLARDRYDVVLTDVRMPGLDGPGLYREVRRRHPDFIRRVAFFTGDALSPTTSAFLAESGAMSVRKPFSLNSLRAALAQVMA
jgi:CheY-like chemotaxis protein